MEYKNVPLHAHIWMPWPFGSPLSMRRDLWQTAAIGKSQCSDMVPEEWQDWHHSSMKPSLPSTWVIHKQGNKWQYFHLWNMRSLSVCRWQCSRCEANQRSLFKLSSSTLRAYVPIETTKELMRLDASSVCSFQQEIFRATNTLEQPSVGTKVFIF